MEWVVYLVFLFVYIQVFPLTPRLFGLKHTGDITFAKHWGENPYEDERSTCLCQFPLAYPTEQLVNHSKSRFNPIMTP